MTDGWFELDSQGALVTWEGVCAVRRRKTVTLSKETVHGILTIVVNVPQKIKIISNGYWTCAELTGRTHNGEQFHFHALDHRNAFNVLKTVSTFPLQQLIVRFDPDPLRKQNCDWISQRVASWISMNSATTPDRFDLILDCNMPM
ncbi:hypothetical protein L596_003068 [Steinernema carpocapsae]|uniref:Uncharacterized protein n=1 Tax=Steinernema carpocapsae TaxID=34508 RepID=A0A4U8UU85_STECR|nr:hypothetical protein L596_003068 [Steinernema carpocapsae]